MKKSDNPEIKPINDFSLKKLVKVFSLPSIKKPALETQTLKERRLSKLFKHKMSKIALHLGSKSKLNLDSNKEIKHRYNNDYFAHKPMVLRSTRNFESHYNPSEISLYVEKENEQLQTSYDILNQVNSTRQYGKGKEENAKELLTGTK